MEHFECPTCGPHVSADEDGCCSTCGQDTIVTGCECLTVRTSVLTMPTPRDRDETPLLGISVLAVVEHWHTKGKRFAVLKAVNESDCNYRTADDNSELSHDWAVIAWDYLPDLKAK